MAVKIKLMRLGKMRAPYYRIVVADARTKRDGRVIETIGKYHPKEDPSFIEVDGERAAYWLGVGAQATDPVERILKVTGDWQRFRGEPAPAPMQVAAPKTDKKAVFEAAALSSAGAGGAATTPKKKAAPRADGPAPAAADVPADPTVKPAAHDVSELPADEAAAAVSVEAEPVDSPAANAVSSAAESSAAESGAAGSADAATAE